MFGLQQVIQGFDIIRCFESIVLAGKKSSSPEYRIISKNITYVGCVVIVS